MDVKKKVQLEGLIYGIVSVVIVLVVDKIILTGSFVSWIAGDWEILVWVVIFLAAMGAGIQAAQKRAITNDKINEIDKKK
jgi:hypothetical protein